MSASPPSPERLKRACRIIRTPHQCPDRVYQIYHLRFKALLILHAGTSAKGRLGLLGGAPSNAREEAVFGEDCYGVYEEDGDWEVCC